jgi:hypothetical protein
MGKISLSVRYAELAPAEAKKKITAPHRGQRHRSERAQDHARDGKQDAGDQVGAGDHPDPPYGVESTAPRKLLDAAFSIA